MSDNTQLNQPAGMQPSTPQGSVAPPQGVQGQAVSPGAGQQGQGQPAQPQQQPVAPGGEQPSQPRLQPPGAMADPARLREQAELNQYRQLMGQLQQQAAIAQEDQALEQQLTMIAATAENLPTGEANTYLKNQVKQLVGKERLTRQQEIQRREAEFQNRERILAAPQYADYLAEQYGLSPDARQELVALGDPDLMHRQAPFIKQRYDSWNAQIAQLQNGQVQQNRTQEVMAATQAGLGAFGGQNVGGTMQIEVPDDPDEKAMAIYAALTGQPGNYRVQ